MAHSVPRIVALVSTRARAIVHVIACALNRAMSVLMPAQAYAKQILKIVPKFFS